MFKLRFVTKKLRMVTISSKIYHEIKEHEIQNNIGNEMKKIKINSNDIRATLKQVVTQKSIHCK
jgi:hypothetical protein